MSTTMTPSELVKAARWLDVLGGGDCEADGPPTMTPSELVKVARWLEGYAEVAAAADEEDRDAEEWAKDCRSAALVLWWAADRLVDQRSKELRECADEWDKLCETIRTGRREVPRVRVTLLEESVEKLRAAARR